MSKTPPSISSAFAADSWQRANKDHLGETMTACNLIPSGLRELVLGHLDGDMKDRFLSACERAHAHKGSLSGIEVHTILNSAKLHALGGAGYLGFMPWHLVERIPTLKAELVEMLSEDLNCMEVQRAFGRNGAINLFIAAKPSDDRESYLRAAKALVGRLPAARVVFDAEIVSFWPESDFKSAHQSVGIEGHLAGVATRDACAQHSNMNAAGLTSVFIDTSGRQFNPRVAVAPANDHGRVADPVDSAETAEAAVMGGDPAPTAPSARTASRLEAIKARQASMRKAA